jgi:hypothetical protein
MDLAACHHEVHERDRGDGGGEIAEPSAQRATNAAATEGVARSGDRRSATIYRTFMSHVIEVTDEELHLLVAALRSFLADFGHDQADLRRSIKALIAKIPIASRPVDPAEPPSRRPATA